MLVMSRFENEDLVFADGLIRVKILGISRKGNKQVVKLGIEAPRDITIDRSEVFDRKILDGTIQLAS
jgi:carbon storage regulator CsrA